MKYKKHGFTNITDSALAGSTSQFSYWMANINQIDGVTPHLNPENSFSLLYWKILDYECNLLPSNNIGKNRKAKLAKNLPIITCCTLLLGSSSVVK